MKKPRVLIADDHSILLAGLQKLVEETCAVVGTVEDGKGARGGGGAVETGFDYPGYLDAALERLGCGPTSEETAA